MHHETMTPSRPRLSHRLPSYEYTAVDFAVTRRTAPGTSVFLLGSLPELGSWDPTQAIKLEPSGYPEWRARVALPHGTDYAYRYFVRPDGPRDFQNPHNLEPIDDTTHHGRTRTSATAYQPIPELNEPRQTLSPPRIEVYTEFPSAYLNNARNIRVYVPRGYDQRKQKDYPVLVVHDGQNCFAPGDVYGSWDIDLTVTTMIADRLLPEMLVVAVDNFGSERIAEYSPPESLGRADDYGLFLTEEVLPFMRRYYRVRQGPRFTATMGSSMGGLVSLYLGWQHPEVFGHVACLSSAFWRSPELMERIRTEPRRNLRIYLDSGDSGEFSCDGIIGTVRTRDLLMTRGYTLGTEFLHVIAFGAEHNEHAWASRVHLPLEWMFGAPAHTRG